jgi:hypothetical protein
MDLDMASVESGRFDSGMHHPDQQSGAAVVTKSSFAVRWNCAWATQTWVKTDIIRFDDYMKFGICMERSLSPRGRRRVGHAVTTIRRGLGRSRADAGTCRASATRRITGRIHFDADKEA